VLEFAADAEPGDFRIGQVRCFATIEVDVANWSHAFFH